LTPGYIAVSDLLAVEGLKKAQSDKLVACLNGNLEHANEIILAVTADNTVELAVIDELCAQMSTHRASCNVSENGIASLVQKEFSLLKAKNEIDTCLRVTRELKGIVASQNESIRVATSEVAHLEESMVAVFNRHTHLQHAAILKCSSSEIEKR
jgi:hypothetical protein